MKKILWAVIIAVAALTLLDRASQIITTGDFNLITYLTEHKFIIAFGLCYIGLEVFGRFKK